MRRLSDERALAALRSGLPDQIAMVVTAWTPAMLRLARAQLDDAGAAEDVVQEAWITVLTGLARFEGRSALRTWVLGIVVNIARRAGERQRRTVALSGQWWQERAELRQPAVDPTRFTADGGWRFPPFAWQATPDEHYGTVELRRVVDRAITDLPARQRAVVVARDGLGLASADVAALFGVTENNQRVLLHRARSRLRAVVEAYAAGRDDTTAAAAAEQPGGTASPSTSQRPPPRWRRNRAQAALACQQLVELVDDYLDGHLDAQLRGRVEEHLDHCHVCPGYVAQVRRLIQITGALTTSAPPDLGSSLVLAVRPANAGVNKTKQPPERGG